MPGPDPVKRTPARKQSPTPDDDERSSLAAALRDFQSEVPTVSKTKQATVPLKSGGNYKYTYADLVAVTDAAYPILGKHGLAFSACPVRYEDGNFGLRGILLHTSGETLTGELPLYGRTPQEIGSSITYGRRYLLGSMTGIVTDDDDDAQVSQGTQAARAHTPTGPSALDQAQRRVLEAWARLHPDQAGDFNALSQDYAQRYGGELIDQAGVERLDHYAGLLNAEAEK